MIKLKLALFAALCGAPLLAAQNKVDLLPSSELKQLGAKLAAKSKTNGGFAGETLNRYGNHYTMLAHREKTGSSELHKQDTDLFVIVDGDCSIITGGKMVNPKTLEANELRGTGIDGGTTQKLGVGDVIHIPANTPHQMILAPGHHITYFVLKVKQ